MLGLSPILTSNGWFTVAIAPSAAVSVHVIMYFPNGNVDVSVIWSVPSSHIIVPTLCVPYV